MRLPPTNRPRLACAFSLLLLAPLRNYIDQRRLAALNDGESAGQGWADGSGIRNRPLTPNSHGLGQLGVTNIRIVDRRADSRGVHAAALEACHFLQGAHLLSIRAIVILPHQKSNLIGRACPKPPPSAHHAAVPPPRD